MLSGGASQPAGLAPHTPQLDGGAYPWPAMAFNHPGQNIDPEVTTQIPKL